MPLSSTDYARLKRLAARAAELSSDADFKEIMTDLKHKIVREWSETSSDATHRREELYRDAIALGRLENYLVDLPGALALVDRKNEQRRT